MLNGKIFLASQSPRRRELVGHIFKSTEILKVVFEEPKWNGEPPLDYLDICVNGKWNQAFPLWKNLSGDSGLLVADTIVSLDGKVLGKPENEREAVQMLTQLSDQWHTVFTGFMLGRGDRKTDVVVAQTSVKFKKLTGSEIKAYVRSGEPMDKAGAYGLQDKAMPFVESVRGPYSNVVGLPLDRIRIEAARLGFV